MRRFTFILAAALAIGVLAPAASADKPTRMLLGNTDFTLPDSCTFPVLGHVLADKEIITTFSDGRQAINGTLKVSLTNTVNGNSMDANISGPGFITPNADGSTTARLEGRSLLFFTPGQLGPGSPGALLLTTGPAVLQFDVSGNLLSFTHTGGTTQDVCAGLA